MKKTVYLYDAASGDYLGKYEAQESPLDPPGTWITPTHSTDAAPPEFNPMAQTCIYAGGAWVVYDKPPAPEPPAPTYKELRAAEYPPVTDYIDGVVKGDQAQIDAYIAACLAVKAKYPK